MLIENGFTVAAPPGQVWSYLLDVEKIAPCMPGAELTETVDERHWKGKMNMAFGPVKMDFNGTVAMEDRDDEAHRVVLNAKGTEQRGKGAAAAAVTAWLEPAGDGTLVKMQADITLTGTAAQLSRGLLPEISKRLTQQFADCLQAGMGAQAQAAAAAAAAAAGAPEGHSAPSETAPRAPVAAAKPVGGIRLGLSAIWATLVGFFTRLFAKKG